MLSTVPDIVAAVPATATAAVGVDGGVGDVEQVRRVHGLARQASRA